VTGLRGVGKTVLLKEYQRIARAEDWVVVRRDLGPRLRAESDFSKAMSDYLRESLEELSVKAKIKNRLSTARDAISDVTIGPMSVGIKERTTRSVLEDRLAKALTEIGSIAREQGRGAVFLFDEAHAVYDDKKNHQFPLGALLSAFVAAQDEDDEPLPVMLVLCGLPPLVGNIHAARSNSERFFRGRPIANLPLDLEEGAEMSEAALALVKPAEDEGSITFEPGLAERIAADVDGYPFFIQWFGEALWDAADLDGLRAIDTALYEKHRRDIQQALDAEFFEPRYRDARPADQQTLRVAGSLGGENFTKSDIDAATSRSSGAMRESLRRLIVDNILYRDDHGVYAYTAPVFGDYLRRAHPRLPEDQ
jgi:hypothetical protein